MKFLITGLLFFSTQTFAKVLPSIFYADKSTQKEFCADRRYHDQNFWRSLMEKRINELTKGQPASTQNSFVTQSYLEIHRKTPQLNGVKFMGYVYANASHHLGRLVRYNAWPDSHPLKKKDRSFVEGPALRALTRLANSQLSPKLMYHSLELYKELSWSLASASLCGMDYTHEMIRDPNLSNAFKATTIPSFIKSFVAFEQTFLHVTMYQELEIKIPAMATILDQMRYMTFNGETHPSFAQWCKETNCRTSSYDLGNRIHFDVWAITNEYNLTKGNVKTLSKRLKNADIEVTANFFSRVPQL
ncbi:MAG: hypothetical protein WDA09_10795 [Bacteriovoracaceae bacterium]